MEPTPAQVLREARARARLSQADLARRARVAQSMISAYESGRREPSVPTLQRLVAATGHRLLLQLDPVPGAARGLPDTRLGRRLRRRRRAILDLAASYGANNVRVFGSVARGEDDASSDIDLLVDLAPGTGVVALAGLRRELGELLGAAVDVVPADSLKPRIRVAALRDAVAL